MSAKKSRITTSPVFISLVYYFIRLFTATYRLRVENEKPWMDHLHAGGRVLLCTWHQQFFSLIRYFRNYSPYGPSLMISRSRDGELIAGVANRTGWYTVRASSSRGGQEGLRRMIDRISATGLAAHIVDGPRGPAGIVKNGAIAIAQESGAVVVPIAVVADRAWYLNSWDRFQVPKPFSKVTIRYGEMMTMPKTGSEEGFEAQRKRLEETMQPGLIGF